jgi:tripeptidyl-peptidase-1
MAPTSETLQAVNDWFASKNIKSKALPGLGDWIGFSTTVKDAESLFGADFVFKHLDIRKEEVRTLSYSIPAELQGHLEVAHPKTTYASRLLGFTRILTLHRRFHNLYKQTPKVSSPSAFKLGPNAPSSLALSCSSSVTPACLQLLHRIPSKPANSTEASIGVTGYIDQYPQKADLKTFLKKYYTDITSTTTFTLQTLDGGSDPQKASSAGIKANLDVLLSAERFMATSVDSTCHNTPSGWRLESRRILSPSATTSRMATSRASSTRSTPSQARSRRRSCSRRRTARTRTP